MINVDFAKISALILHKVGNKLSNEGIIFSGSSLSIDTDINNLLLQFFFTPFKSSEYYTFCHETDINLNEIYVYLSKIFDDENNFEEQSRNIAKHLYEKSTHPKIKSGELYIVYLDGCSVEGVKTSAIGIFKSESKETYLRIYPSGNSFEINSDKGVNINKLDKGCIVFNTEKEHGYIISIVDTTKGSDIARFWADDFLQTKIRQDEYSQTKNIMSLCQEFIKTNPNIEKVEKVDIINKTASYLKQNDSFNINSYATQVLADEKLKSSFNDFKSTYEQKQEFVIPNEFKVSEQAFKKNTRTLKSLIKLDNNFKISINGGTQYIEKGYDNDKKMNYYKLYYRNEE